MFFGFKNDGNLCHNIVLGRRICMSKSKDENISHIFANFSDYQVMLQEWQLHILIMIGYKYWKSLIE